MLQRAYSLLTLKSATTTGDKRILTGTATTPEPDRMGDVVVPKGAKFKLPIPFLWQHDAHQPVGQVTKAKVTGTGIEVEIQMAQTDEPGTLKDLLDYAWQSIKLGLVQGLSIGFSPTEMEPLDPKQPYGGMKFLQWDWLELSGVTIPANAGAGILALKTIDHSLIRKAASGQLVPKPGVSGTTTRNHQGNTVKTLAQLFAERADKTTRMGEIKSARETEKRGYTAEEKSELDTIRDEVNTLDDDIREKEMDDLMVRRSVRVDDADTRRRGVAEGHIFVSDKKDADQAFKGQNFTRGVIAKALAHKLHVPASQVAAHRWGKSSPMLVEIIKANEVPGGGEQPGKWGTQLVTVNNSYTGDFLEYLYGLTVFDKLPLREIPANVAIKGQDGAATGYWVGENKGIPATAPSFENAMLTPLKVAALAVCSNELLADSSPAAEQLIRDALAEASAQRIDTTFLSAAAAVANVSPAGILFGVTGTASHGTNSQEARNDIKALLQSFITAKNTGDLTMVMSRGQAASLGLMFSALGIPEFPGISIKGGSLAGYNVVVGDNVPNGDVIMLNPREIYKIGDSGIQVSVSTEATIEQNTVPTGATDIPVAASADMTSMFQEESTAIKIVRRINFAKRRTFAVALITGANYDAGNS